MQVILHSQVISILGTVATVFQLTLGDVACAVTFGCVLLFSLYGANGKV